MMPEEQMTFMHYLFDVAWADGSLEREEAEILSTILSGIDLSDDDASTLRGWFEEPPPEPDWSLAQDNQELGDMLMRQSLVLAGADLEYTADEMSYLARLRDRLGMEEDRYHAIWKGVETLLAQGRARGD